MSRIWESSAWADLQRETSEVQKTHLRDLMQDASRTNLSAEFDGIFLDYSRQRVTAETMRKLHALAAQSDLRGKIAAMAAGAHLNVTEDRAVLHMALRSPAGVQLVVDGVDVAADVAQVAARIRAFADRVRSGEHVGVTGKALTDVISIGIGGSYLGVEFVYEALRGDATAGAGAAGRRLRFLANVDPVDAARALEGLNPETALVLIISKTFTTAETMLNAKTVRSWLLKGLAGKAEDSAITAAHMAAVSTAVPLVTAFGIAPSNIFGFWDWVGGRYSVTSAVGTVPLSLIFGPAIVDRFLAGAHAMDVHFTTAPHEANLPVLMGLLGVWNATFLGHASRALLPYSQALLRFPAHIQQVDMESNGKRVSISGETLPFETGPVNFGEPGTNGQHSFYQLVHQGRVVPADFIGFIASQSPISLRECRGDGMAPSASRTASHTRSSPSCSRRACEQPRRADVQLLCAARRAGDGQDGRGGRRGGRIAIPCAAQGVSRQPPLLLHSAAQAGRVHVRAAARPVRASHGGGGLCLGHLLL
jgi:glucose-6-phosphate isomerase